MSDPRNDLPDDVADVGLVKLSKDLKASVGLLGRNEVRFLVDFYYDIQANRIRSAAQVREAAKARGGAEPNKLLDWCETNFQVFENLIKSALNAFTKEYTVGLWCQSICGIGPVIAAGLLAHIDITKCSSYGSIQRFAGLDATVDWPSTEDAKKWVKEQGIGVSEDLVKLACAKYGRRLDSMLLFMTPKGKKEVVWTVDSLAKAISRRPWNESLHTLCAFKLGESFVKVQNNKNDYYGQIYARRKLMEHEENKVGKYGDQARKILETTDIGKETDAYQWYSGRMTPAAIQTFFTTPPEKRMGLAKKLAGSADDCGIRMLPPDHIHSRARRYAVKLFIAHLYHVMFVDYHGMQPRVPLPFEKLGHDKNHYLPPPNWPLTEPARSLKTMLA